MSQGNFRSLLSSCCNPDLRILNQLQTCSPKHKIRIEKAQPLRSYLDKLESEYKEEIRRGVDLEIKRRLMLLDILK